MHRRQRKFTLEDLPKYQKQAKSSIEATTDFYSNPKNIKSNFSCQLDESGRCTSDSNTITEGSTFGIVFVLIIVLVFVILYIRRKPNGQSAVKEDQSKSRQNARSDDQKVVGCN